MASTRNRNTQCNYQMEQQQYAHARCWTTYEHSSQGSAYSNQLAGRGLIQGRMPWNQLSYNPVDIDTFLKGIGSTNLVDPKGNFTAELKTSSLSSANLYEQPIVWTERPTFITPNQRPTW